MLSKRNIIETRTSIEAGYVNHDADLGKATNHGITEDTALEHKHLWDSYAFTGDMRELPIELAYAIYEESWWDKLHLDDIMEISPELCERLFDFGINTGRYNAVLSLQRILNVSNRQGKLYDDLEPDGGMGKLTKDALKAYLAQRYVDQDSKLISLMISMQNYYYIDISERRVRNEEFTNGWTSRVWHDTKNFMARYFKSK